MLFTRYTCICAGKAVADKRRRDVLATAGSSGSSAAAAAPPKWFVTADELNRVPAYMKGRLTLEKVRQPANLPPMPVKRGETSLAPHTHTPWQALPRQLTQALSTHMLQGFSHRSAVP